LDYRKLVYERYVSTHLGKIVQTNDRLLLKYHRLNFLPHLPPDKDAPILDIGCGMGQFLEFLHASGYKNCRGIDRGEEAVQYCLSRGFSVENAEALDYLSHYPNSYAAIVLNDIVEHFTKSEVFDLIHACHQALQPNGGIIIKTANAANPLTGAHSLAIDLTHEILFSEESLAQLLNVVGFRNVKVLPLNIYANRYNPLHWIARCFAECLNFAWRVLYTLYGRPGTRCFTKSILAVGRK